MAAWHYVASEFERDLVAISMGGLLLVLLLHFRAELCSGTQPLVVKTQRIISKHDCLCR
jgi:hypothetical protein